MHADPEGLGRASTGLAHQGSGAHALAGGAPGTPAGGGVPPPSGGLSGGLPGSPASSAMAAMAAQQQQLAAAQQQALARLPPGPSSGLGMDGQGYAGSQLAGAYGAQAPGQQQMQAQQQAAAAAAQAAAAAAQQQVRGAAGDGEGGRASFAYQRARVVPAAHDHETSTQLALCNAHVQVRLSRLSFSP